MKRIQLLVLLILLGGCGGEDPAIRERKIQIAQQEDRRTAGPQREIASLIFHRDPEIRRRAVIALGRIGESEAIAEIAGAETLDTSVVRAPAAWAMGLLARDFRSDLAEQFLSSLYRDTTTAVRRNVMDAMAYINSAEVEQFLQIFGLLDGNPVTRGAAATSCALLGEMKDPRDLIGLLRDEEPEVRWRAAWALWRLKEPRAKLGLLLALRDEDPRVRMFAARGLAEVGDAESGDSLVRLLEDPDWRVRNHAALAIGRVGASDEVIDRLVERLQGEEHELVAQTVAEAVGNAGRPSDVPALKAMVKRRSGTIWTGVINALADNFPDSSYDFIAAMIADPRLGVAQASAAALGRMGSESARGFLALQYDQTEDETRKGFLLDGLKPYGWINLEFFIDDALKSDNLVLALTAADALSMRADTSSTRRLGEFWQRHAADSIADFKIAALQSAGALIDSMAPLGRQMQPWLETALDDPDRLVRAEAIKALAQLGVDASDRLGEFASEIDEDSYDDIFREFKTNPTAIIETDRGAIEIELYYDVAPVTVHNFVQLAADGFYDGIVFHRVVPNFVIQAGDPDGTGWGGPGYTIRSQYSDLTYGTGTVGMASSGKDTEGSQFFITHSPQPHLDDRYTIFGQVVSGQDVVDAIRQGDKIVSIQIQS